MIDRDILLHELAHGLANLHCGALKIDIKWDAVEECATAHATWPDSVKPDAAFIGLLAGRLHLDGVNNADDEMILSQLPKQEINRLWAVIIEEVKPKFDKIPDGVLDDMLKCIEEGDYIQLRPEILH
jgi:hypothetical protein